MHSGTYRDRAGQLVSVRTTPTGLLLTYPGGPSLAVSTESVHRLALPSFALRSPGTTCRAVSGRGA